MWNSISSWILLSQCHRSQTGACLWNIMTLFCFVLQSKIRDAWWISTNWHKQREHQAVSQTINWNLSPPYVVTQTHWLAGSQLIGRWKANEASMQETQKEGVFWYHRVKLELTATGCFYCQEVYLGLKAIWFKGDKAVKSYQTEKHIYLGESPSCLVSTGWQNGMEWEESFSCTPSQALLGYWLLLETG